MAVIAAFEGRVGKTLAIQYGISTLERTPKQMVGPSGLEPLTSTVSR